MKLSIPSASTLQSLRLLLGRWGRVPRVLAGIGAVGIVIACGDALMPTEPEAVPALRMMGATSGATVTTDKADYPPGETVKISGSGWLAGETVQFRLTEDRVDGDQPLVWSTAATASGTIADSTFMTNERHLGVTFTLVATGQTSGATAQTTFTDGNLKITASTSSNITLTYIEYGSTNCGASPGSTKTGSISLTNTQTIGIGSSQSARLDPPAVALGLAFSSWTFDASVVLVPALPAGTTTSTTRVLCVLGFSGNGSKDLKANYQTASIGVTPSSGTYGGTAALTATLSPAASGKSISFSLNGTPVGSATTDAAGVASLGAASLGTINAGTYGSGISASFAGDAGYPAANGTGALTVNKANASATAAANTKTYGAADPVLTGTLSGFLIADGITATYSRTAGESVAGSYTISATLAPFAALANYNVTYSTASFTITKANASVQPNGASKTYGTADPALSGTLTGFVGADGVSATYSRTPGENVAGGPYTISATLAPTGVLANYNVTYNTAAFTINRAAASVTPAAASKTYGAADPAFGGTLSGFAIADGVTASYGRTAGETVAGSPYSISATLAATGTLSNYDITYNTAAFTINKASASVTPAAASKTYGTADPTFSGSLSGFVASDAITAAYSRTSGETVGGGPYSISAVLSPAAALGNYNITYNTANFTINKAALSVTAANASRVYGDPNPTFTGTLNGVVAGDNITASYIAGSGGLVNATTAVGSYEIAPQLIDPDGRLGNYDVTLTSGSLTINKAPLTIAADNKSRTYGDGNPALTGSISGIKNADGITATYATAADATTGIGSYAITPTAVDASPTKLGNYEVTLTNGSLTINKAPLTIAAADKSKIYGDANPPLTGSISGIKNSDGITATYATTAGATTGIGSYAITPTAVDATPTKLGNYEVTLTNGSLTINKAPLTIAADNKSRTYGDGNPPLTGSISGIKNSDGITASYATTAVAATDIGSYAITPTAVDASPTKLGNYEVTLTNGSLTINKAPLTITADSKNRLYGQPNPVFTGNVVGIRNGDALGASYSTVATVSTLLGDYAIVPAAVDATPSKIGNYQVALVNGTLTIGNEPPVITGVTGPVTPTELASAVVVTGNFTDVGLTGDNYTISSSWASATSPTFTIAGVTSTPPYNGSAGTFTITSASIQPGVYTVTVTVTDRFGASSAAGSAASTVSGYVVVYDPRGGFVTGGGWINSPAGACSLSTCTATSSGKANFGFVSKYQNGAKVPTGNTEFQFKAGNLNFKATVYEWLVISGSRAQYKGTGTINGGGSYSFILTVIDGKINGGDGLDRFRIKIMDGNAGNGVVYDNQIETGDDASLTTNGTLLGGGSITVHNK